MVLVISSHHKTVGKVDRCGSSTRASSKHALACLPLVIQQALQFCRIGWVLCPLRAGINAKRGAQVAAEAFINAGGTLQMMGSQRGGTVSVSH
jgi:hypothetical protein